MNSAAMWTNCGCSTVYTDAWGNPITGPCSGADGSSASATGDCKPDWGIIAFMGFAAIVGMAMAKPKGKA